MAEVSAMTSTIFDLLNLNNGSQEEEFSEEIVQKQAPKEKKSRKDEEAEFIEFALSQPEPEAQPSKIRSILGAAPKGFLREGGKEVRKTLTFLPKLFGLDEELQQAPISDEEAEEKLQQLFPTQEGYLESSLERAGEIAPYSLLGGGGVLTNILRTLGAGFAGQGAKELGGGPIVQTAAEIGAFGLPGLGKKINPTKAQKEIVEEARALGLTDKEIAPLIQGENKQKFLSKLAERRGRSQQALKSSKGKLDTVYKTLQKGEEATKTLSSTKSNKVVKSIQDKLSELPSATQDLISKDFTQLLEKPITGDSLINFYSDINSTYSKGGAPLGILKEPIKDALSSISPKLANNFQTTNKLYSKYYQIANRLKPNLVSDLVTAGEATRLMFGVATGNFPLLIETVGESAARSLATEMLINPRFQNLGNKMVSALNQNSVPAAKRILQQMIKETKDVSPEVARELQKLDISKVLGDTKE